MKIIRNLPGRIRVRQRGSILVICMVLAGVGTIGAAAFFTLLQAKTEESEQSLTSSHRRAKQANSLALAKEVILRKYVDTDTGPAATETHTLPGGWGEAVIEPFTEAPMGTTAATRQHKTGAVPNVAYATDVAVTTSDGDIVHPWQFQIKSATPAMMRDLFVIHEPTINEADRIKTDKVRVKGRAFVWVGGAADEIKMTAERVFMVDPSAPDKVELYDFADNELKPDNFPFMNNTNGRIKGEARPFYDGRLSIVENTDMTSPSYVDVINAQAIPPVQLDGLVETEWSTDPVVINMPDGSAITGSGGVEAGGYPADVYSVIRQALDARVRLWMAVRASLAIGDKVQYSYQDVKVGVPDFSTWYTDEKEFDASDWPGCYSDFLSAANQLMSDLTSAMSTLGGPDPNVGAWWPATPDPGLILPPEVNPYWVDNNPYPGGWWVNAPAGSSGDGQIHIDIAKSGNVRIANNTEVIILEGQPDATSADAAALLDPLMIVMTNAFDTELKLEDIEFQGINKRPVVFALKQEYDPATVQKAKDEGKGRGNSLDGKGGKDVTHKEIDLKFDKDTTPAFPSWRIFLEMENTPLKVDLGDVGNAATFVGSVRTDASFNGTGDGLTIEADPDVGDTVNVIGLRYAWLETFRN